MPSLIAHSMKLFSRAYIRINPSDADSLVAHLRRSMNHSPIPVMLPAGVRHEPWSEGALSGDRLVVAKPEKVLLYLHGGGYVCGKTRTYFNFCSRLARELNAEVLLPAYRVAPEHPFPAAIEDAVAAYEHLLRKGWRPDQITIAGDSAGGGLTLGALLALRDARRPMPRCAVLISPFADVRAIAPSVKGNDATDYMLGARMLEVGRNVYARTPQDAVHPYASPALGDFTGLPPLYITVCDHECLRDDAYLVEARALAAGVPVTLLSRPDLFHVWPVFAPVLPEAREDLPRIANFIRGAGRNAHLRNVVALNAGGASTLAAAGGEARAVAAPRARPAATTTPSATAAQPAATPAGKAAGTARAAKPKAATPKPATTSDGAAAGPAASKPAKAGKAPAPKPAAPGKAAPAPKAEKPARAGKPAKTEKAEKAEKAPKPGKADKPAKAEKPGKDKAAGPKPRSLDKPKAPLVKADEVNTGSARGKPRKAG